MPDIKTRDVVSGTIKTIDRSTLAGQRMKDAYVQAKDKAEHSVYSTESTSEEYASERIMDGASTVAREAVHQVDVQGHRIIQGAQRKFTQQQENPQPQQSPPQSTSGSPQSSPNTHASISPQQVQNSPEQRISTMHSSPTGYLPMGLLPLVWVGTLKLAPVLRFQSRNRFAISKLLLPKRN